MHKWIQQIIVFRFLRRKLREIFDQRKDGITSAAVTSRPATKPTTEEPIESQTKPSTTSSTEQPTYPLFPLMPNFPNEPTTESSTVSPNQPATSPPTKPTKVSPSPMIG